MSLPTHAQLGSVTSAMFGHVTSPDQPLAAVLGGLKVILCLCQHNMGLQHVYRYAHRHSNVCTGTCILCVCLKPVNNNYDVRKQ